MANLISKMIGFREKLKKQKNTVKRKNTVNSMLHEMLSMAQDLESHIKSDQLRENYFHLQKTPRKDG